MANVPPFHSSEKDIMVYHNDDLCTEGNNIEERNWVNGAGEKRLCEHCQRIALEDAMHRAKRIDEAKKVYVRVKK